MTGRPHSASVWDERETWSRNRLDAYQLDALRRQLIWVSASSDFYRRKFTELGWEPGDLREHDDLRRLPFTRKADYVAALDEMPPWGSALACSPPEARRVHFSSGTTARPTPVYWTAGDLDRWADLYARSAYAQGVRADDVYQCLFSFSWFVGGLGAIAGYQRIGALCIPGGSVDSRRQVETIFAFGTTCVGGTPSFMLHLAEVAAELGRDLRDSAVTKVMVGGEPGAGIPATRARIEKLWGAACYDGYGSLEFQPIAWECEAGAGGHLAEDFLYAEVLDPDTGEPVADGRSGVLVLTHLDKEACPLVRWWTDDVVVRDRAPCDCGRTHARLPGGVRGRVADMLLIRGVNVFPSAVEEVIRGTAGTTGEFQIVLDGDVRDPHTGYLSALKLRVEAEPDAAGGLADRVATCIRDELGVRAHVDVLAAGALPRATHKATRIVKKDRP